MKDVTVLRSGKVREEEGWDPSTYRPDTLACRPAILKVAEPLLLGPSQQRQSTAASVSPSRRDQR